METAILPSEAMVECYHNRTHHAEFQAVVNKTTVVRKKELKPSPKNPVFRGVGFIVDSVHRIRNTNLLELYTNKKASIKLARNGTELVTFETTTGYLPPEHSSKFDSAVNEGYLFRPARFDELEGIKAHGFEPTPGPLGLWTMSFTDSITRADQHIDPKEKVIWVFVARVCMGRPWVMREHECPKQNFDSLVKQVDTDDTPFREFHIFDKHQAYPEYLLKLTRKLDSPRDSDPSKWSINETCDWAEEVIPLEQARLLKREEVNGPLLLILGVKGIESCGLLPQHAKTIDSAVHELKAQVNISPGPFFHPMDPDFVVNVALNCPPSTKFCPQEPQGLLELATHHGLVFLSGLAEGVDQLVLQMGNTIQRSFREMLKKPQE